MRQAASQPLSLSVRLLRELSGEPRAAIAALPDLEERLGALLLSVAESWPDVKLPIEDLLCYLTERLSLAEAPADLLALEAARELFLACACANGDPAALATFERCYFREVEAGLARFGCSADQVDEVKQLLRRRLFLANGAARPRIADYAGRGSLRGLVRVAATRAALDLFAKLDNERPLADPGALASSLPDPELQFAKSECRVELKRAVEEAARALTVRERSLLRYHLVDGLGIDEIAMMYRVHRSTAARWLAGARVALAAETRRRLAKALRLGKQDAESAVRLVQSELDLTLSRIFQEEEASSRS